MRTFIQGCRIFAVLLIACFFYLGVAGSNLLSSKHPSAVIVHKAGGIFSGDLIIESNYARQKLLTHVDWSWCPSNGLNVWCVTLSNDWLQGQFRAGLSPFAISASDMFVDLEIERPSPLGVEIFGAVSIKEMHYSFEQSLPETLQLNGEIDSLQIMGSSLGSFNVSASAETSGLKGKLSSQNLLAEVALNKSAQVSGKVEYFKTIPEAKNILGLIGLYQPGDVLKFSENLNALIANSTGSSL